MSAPDWQWRALDWRKERKTYPEIAALLGVTKHVVKYWCNPDRNHSKRESRARDALANPSPKRVAPEPHHVTAEWTKRQPTARLDYRSIPEATRLFAAGKIDRAELMRRITP